MSNVAAYFKANRPEPKFHIGDRVFGYFGGTPFIGTVGNDRMVNEEAGSMVSVHLFLPINGTSVINVKPDTLKLLKVYI